MFALLLCTLCVLFQVAVSLICFSHFLCFFLQMTMASERPRFQLSVSCTRPIEDSWAARAGVGSLEGTIVPSPHGSIHITKDCICPSPTSFSTSRRIAVSELEAASLASERDELIAAARLGTFAAARSAAELADARIICRFRPRINELFPFQSFSYVGRVMQKLRKLAGAGNRKATSLLAEMQAEADAAGLTAAVQDALFAVRDAASTALHLHRRYENADELKADLATALAAEPKARREFLLDQVDVWYSAYVYTRDAPPLTAL